MWSLQSGWKFFKETSTAIMLERSTIFIIREICIINKYDIALMRAVNFYYITGIQMFTTV